MSPLSKQLARQQTRQRGLSVVETLIAMAVLGLVVSAITESVVTGQMHMHAGLHAQRANMLLQDLMEQVVALPYDDPNDDDTVSAIGPEPSELDVLDFDNADDYHGYSESVADSVDPSGAAYPDEFNTFSRSVDAAYDDLTVTGLTGTVPGLTVTVTVQDARGQTWSATRYITETITP
jgi:hypothetical protein